MLNCGGRIPEGKAVTEGDFVRGLIGNVRVALPSCFARRAIRLDSVSPSEKTTTCVASRSSACMCRSRSLLLRRPRYGTCKTGRACSIAHRSTKSSVPFLQPTRIKSGGSLRKRMLSLLERRKWLDRFELPVIATRMMLRARILLRILSRTLSYRAFDMPSRSDPQK